MVDPKLIIVETVDAVKNLRAYIKQFDYIFYDTETTGVHKGAEIMGFGICAEDDKSYYVILHRYNPTTKKIEYGAADLLAEATALISDLQTKNLIEHNGIFDSMITLSYFKISLIDALHTCTMVLAHLLNENRKVGLKELAKELLGVSAVTEQEEMKASVLANGGQWTKKQKDMYMADPYLLAKYGAKDPWLTKQIFFSLLADLHDQHLTEFFYDQETMPLLKGPTWDLNTTGLQVDVKALNILKKSLEAECAEIKALIYKEIAPHIKEKKTFNIGSSKQLAWLLFGKLELEFGNLTKGGKIIAKQLMGKLPYTYTARRDFILRCLNQQGSVYQPEAVVNGKKVRAKKIKAPWDYIAVDKEMLKKIAPKLKWVEKLLEYQKKMKLLNTYVKGIESRIQYGVINPNYLQHGTVTGRYASRNPNLQNLPRDDQRVKECFIARPGKVYVSADYSQLEPRTFASYSRDEKLMNAFDGKTDFYSVVGMEVYDKSDCEPQKDGSPNAFGIKYKSLRDCSKVIALASAYGATPNKLAPITRKSIEDTASDMEKYFERFPGVQTMMLEAHNLAMKQGFVTNLFGRIRRIPAAMKIKKIYGNTAHADLPYEARQLLNMACNFRIQSTGASIVNRAAVAFHNGCKEAGIECKLVSQIHDELVAECREQDADIIKDLLQMAMETTTILPGVKLEAIPRVTRNLAK